MVSKNVITITFVCVFSIWLVSQATSIRIGYLNACINLLAREFFFLILEHSVYKVWIIQETNKLDILNKLHFEEEKMESIYHV